MWTSKDVYYISDSTGILATNLGQSLLCQFPGIHFHEEHLPFIRTVEDAENAIGYILKHSGGRRPLIFSTMMDRSLIEVFDRPEVEFFDAYERFLSGLEHCLEAKALRVPGFSRRIDNVTMAKRVEAIHFTLEHDDGVKVDDFHRADVILVGVSRSGKTPVSVYLATQMGLKAANFPLTTEFLTGARLPDGVKHNLDKAVALTTTGEILHQVRKKRLPDSNYAKLATCMEELDQANSIYYSNHMPIINTAGKSIEEIATQVMQEIGISKKPASLSPDS
ncbi:MAG: pyruvate, phosphate dikinase/phosphoenolpyruvate synthase regulator [Thermodesulfobacteriota bacterium]